MVEEFCKKLDLALADEEKAAKEYTKMKEESPYDWVADEFRRIIFQEINHFGSLTNLKKVLCR